MPSERTAAERNGRTTSRRRLGWTALVGALVLAVSVVVSACGGSESDSEAGGESGGDKSVAMFAYSLQDPWGIAQAEAAEETAKKEGVSLKVFDGGSEADKQLNQVEDAVASGQYEGMIISPIDGQGIAPGVEDADAEDIKVICTGSPCGPDGAVATPQVEGQLAYVGVTSDVDGEIQGELVVEYCETRPSCEVGYIEGFASSNTDQARLKTFEEAISKSPNAKLVATAEGGYEKAPSLKVAQDMIQAHPNIAVIAGASDNMVEGAQQAAEAAGKEIAFVGNAASEQGVAKVAAGEWLGDTVWLPRTETEVSVQMLVEALEGEEVPDSVEIREKSPIGPAVTKQNAAEFEAQWGQ